jgi:hypothetical protein
VNPPALRPAFGRARGRALGATVGPLLGALLLGACQSPENGTGRVDATLRVAECRPSGDLAEDGYGWEASRLNTKRFHDTLTVVVQEFAVDLEETDGLLLRIPNLEVLRGDRTRPLVRRLGRDRDGLNASLSLFQTCPDRPTLNVATGTVSFDVFEIAADPEDTGVGERVEGSLSGALVGVDGRSSAGRVEARFAFEPLTRPVSEPR